MKKFRIAIVGIALVFGPALYAQDVVTGVKDLGKDVDKGTKKTGDAKAADDFQGHREGAPRGCRQDG